MKPSTEKMVPASEIEQMLRPVHVAFNPNKIYSYVWPGAERAEIKGSELTALCKGADVSMLDIQEVDTSKVEATKKPIVTITSAEIIAGPGVAPKENK